MGTRRFGGMFSLGVRAVGKDSYIAECVGKDKHFYCADVLSLFLNYTNVLFEDRHVRLVKFAPRKGKTNFVTLYAYTGQSS